MIDFRVLKELEEFCDVTKDLKYSKDETPPLLAPKPADFIVVKPKNTEEVSKILKIANKYRIPIFIRGGGTGLSGGAIPTSEGIVLSTEYLKDIRIDEKNRFAECGAGVTLYELENAAETYGLSFPPHPGAETATVGGMIATNAGGMRALKYGTIRNYVLSCEVVLADGSILEIGSRTLKNSTGYSLLHLFIGSEGTLGVITRAVLKLLPSMKDSVALVAPFNSLEEAAEQTLNLTKLLPLSLELIEARAVKIGEKITGKKWPGNGEAYIFAIFERFEDVEKASEVLKKDVYVAVKKELRNLMSIRGSIYEGLKDKIIEILDVCVPPAEVANYIRASSKIFEKYGVDVVTYGHAGDGNIHQHPLLYDGWESSYFKFREELFNVVLKLGGVISGEHGIGALKREEFKKFYPKQYEVMKKIKQVFDPSGILNPGKIF
ncbi:MAG: FAD-binding oxidoreductase [Archaeoglobaceae archaeon]|nr:FAD-binding oxidoreductase [Archaeoglobaceae archaeon]MCX8152058.1 FAD-binding oxidoreductase [Archaeoglobaceae archaeon]MDW8013823.1 FAD-binding oxidoreductase [Archaeoglobaceae archaeon]